VHSRYRRAGRAEKGRILDEFCKTAEYNRKYAVRLLNGPPPEPRPETPRRWRGPSYSAKAITALAVIWEAAGYPWSVRLKALLPTWLPWARKRLGLSKEVERQLQAISPRQIDRRLAEHKRKAKRRLFGRTKPGTLLKHQIPIKTDSWRVTAPGSCEVDLVSHSGSNAAGEFIHSLNMTDIFSTWTETAAVMGKGQFGVQRALDEMRLQMPFSLQAIDSDNGSEFINMHLLRYCRRKKIQFTRGRPYKKDDNAHIEQKNWTHVRKLLGYVRYDSEQALHSMNRLYRGDLRLLQNLFLPSVKLVRKERVGAKLRRRYDTPRTPLERLDQVPNLDQAVLARLVALRDSLDPFALSRSVERQLAFIYGLSTSPPSARPRAAGAVGDVPARVEEGRVAAAP
jgi:hypothetical protein